jgi:hypothetical protein
MKNVIQMVRNMVSAPRSLPPQPVAIPPEPAAAPQASAALVVNILDYYVTAAPDPQNALDIFKNEWASRLPEPLAALHAGAIPLFEDPRIDWALEQWGGVEGRTVLELGPLEAGHTYMIERAGAASILSIEANTRAYLKCLIVKELLELHRARFVCGDFVEFLRTNQAHYDVCIASGVLYHMRNPIELLALLAKASDRLYIWSHYYDHNLLSNNPVLADKYTSSNIAEYEGFKCELYRQEYLSALNVMHFCGGSDVYSLWMKRDDILACLRYFGYDNIQTHFEQPDHPNGPSFGLIATRGIVN